MNNDDKDKLLARAIKTWRGKVMVAYAMLSPSATIKETFEQFFERFEYDRRQKWEDQHKDWLALPLATRMIAVISFQIWHKKTFGFWHPDNVVEAIRPRFPKPDEIT